MVPRLFGTDGIRGRVVAAQQDESKAIAALHEQRVICTSLLRLVGEALGRTMDTLPGRGTTVVVGWDDRPNNLELSGALTLGLRLTGCHVIHIGLCATPALHRATLLHGARMGCMITASHNPVSDSGLKVFDSNGFKSSPMYEDHVSLVADSLAAEEREIDQIESSELSQPSEPFVANPEMHGEWLAERFLHLQSLIGPRAFATTGIARADGVTLHAPREQLSLLQGLILDYRGDLSGGGFLIRGGDAIQLCACGSAFSRQG